MQPRNRQKLQSKTHQHDRLINVQQWATYLKPTCSVPCGSHSSWCTCSSKGPHSAPTSWTQIVAHTQIQRNEMKRNKQELKTKSCKNNTLENPRRAIELGSLHRNREAKKTRWRPRFLRPFQLWIMDLPLPIFHLQDSTESFPFTHVLHIWDLFTDFSFVRLYKKSSFQLWIMDLFLPIFHLQDCTKSLSFTHVLHIWDLFTDFSFVRLYKKSSFQLWIMDLFLPIFHLQDSTESLPFTHVLHVWDHLNCKNLAAKEHHLPCH